MASINAILVAVCGTPLTEAARRILTVLSCATGLCALLQLSQLSGHSGSVESIATPFALSHIALVSITVAVSCQLFRRVPARNVRNTHAHSRHLVPAGFVLAASLALPLAYGHMAARSARESAAEAIQAERYGQALRLCDVLRATDSCGTIFDKPVADVVHMLERYVASLELSVASPLPDHADSDEVGQYVVCLMQLDRNEDARNLMLSRLKTGASNPVAMDYIGLCCQRMQRWEESREWYTRSKDFWSRQTETRQRTSALLSASKGIAFAERQLDRPAAAEKAYLDALAVADAAEIHFLLARFYEDYQRTQRSADHARRAMRLDPTVYKTTGSDLIQRLSHSHFGCLWVQDQANHSTRN